MRKTNLQKGFTAVEIIVVAAVLVAAGFGGLLLLKKVKKAGLHPTPVPMISVTESSTLSMSFEAQNDSGLKGSYRVVSVDSSTGVNSSVKVIVNLNSYEAGVSMPAHIHYGTCANIGGVKYALSSVVNGGSETIINTTLFNLRSELPLAINIHKSADQPNVYVGCADLNVDGSLDVIMNGAAM